ncbi:MAG TPA: hypothetical protein VHZ51_25920 [Ktedonobacteraceae bacterium]|nr:hypothetical protein [Ktedonobacteraceae bacterium]
MNSIADGSVIVQTTSRSEPSTPPWFGEVVLLTAHLSKHGVFNKINEQVRFARRRFGRYDMIDFLAVLFGYAISGERTDGGSFTKASSPLRSRSWRCLNATSCPPAQRSPVF